MVALIAYLRRHGAQCNTQQPIVPVAGSELLKAADALEASLEGDTDKGDAPDLITRLREQATHHAELVEALRWIESHETDSPCMNEPESVRRTLAEVQQKATEALAKIGGDRPHCDACGSGDCDGHPEPDKAT
jgi:hypothetical protein